MGRSHSDDPRGRRAATALLADGARGRGQLLRHCRAAPMGKRDGFTEEAAPCSTVRRARPQACDPSESTPKAPRDVAWRAETGARLPPVRTPRPHAPAAPTLGRKGNKFTRTQVTGRDTTAEDRLHNVDSMKRWLVLVLVGVVAGISAGVADTAVFARFLRAEARVGDRAPAHDANDRLPGRLVPGVGRGGAIRARSYLVAFSIP